MGRPMTTPAAALDYLAGVYAHCEDVTACPADLWIEGLERGRVMLQHTDKGTVERARQAIKLLGGWAQGIRQKTVYRYRDESGGWSISHHKRDELPARAYVVYMTTFRLSQRILQAIQLDLEGTPDRAA